jgi:endonuclease/exonuclease/phosphatase family metal-dependent hydrolase
MPTVFKIVSWNIKDFGDYDRSPNIEFMAGILKSADIIVIEEVVCNRFAKRQKVNVDQARQSGIDAVEEIVQQLNVLDAAGMWADPATVTGVNATSPKRDAYCYMWKTKPSNSKFPSNANAPKVITLKDTDILSTDSGPNFPDRRPGYGIFTIDTVDITVIAHHASVPVNSKRAVQSCQLMAEVDEIKTPPSGKGIIVGDFNADFTKAQMVTDVYKYLADNIGYVPCLGDIAVPSSGVLTTLKSKWTGSDDYRSSAYDNILIKGLTKRAADVMNAVDEYRLIAYPTKLNSTGLFLSWQKIYPMFVRKAKFTIRKKKAPCVSDHLPVYALLEI